MQVEDARRSLRGCPNPIPPHSASKKAPWSPHPPRKDTSKCICRLRIGIFARPHVHVSFISYTCRCRNSTPEKLPGFTKISQAVFLHAQVVDFAPPLPIR